MLEQKYDLRINYPDGNVCVFFFSRELTRESFSKNLLSNRYERRRVFENMYNTKFESDILADLYLYQHKERRNFKIIWNGKLIENVRQLTISINLTTNLTMQ